MLSTTSAFLSVQANLPRQQAATAADPQVKSDTAYYLANIGKVKTADDLVNNYRLFSYAMKAYGLSSMSYAKGFMAKLLKDGTAKPTALANTLSDQRYLAFAKAFDFAGKGSAATAQPSATSTAVSQYVQQTLEDNQGSQNQGVELALYFSRKASGVTSAYGILADSALLKVVQVAYGIPATSGVQDIDIQYAALNRIMNVKDLQDPKKVQQLITRFTAQWDATGNNPSASQASNALLVSDTSSFGLSSDLLMSIAGLKHGG